MINIAILLANNFPIHASGKIPGSAESGVIGGGCQIDSADWRARTSLRRCAYCYLDEFKMAERKAEPHGFVYKFHTIRSISLHPVLLSPLSIPLFSSK